MSSSTTNTDPSEQSASRLSLTPTMEDYLRQIYKLEEEGNERVSNSTVADRLGVSQPTVTSMFRTLEKRGLIEREKYHPVRLTDDGRAVTLGIVRRHRLAETLLLDVFGYGLSEVDAEADVLEHHLSDRLCRAIERELDMPESDPHGDPIPDENLNVRSDETATPLADVTESSAMEVTRILTQDDEVLEYLVDSGIEPSARLQLEEKSAIGMVVVSVDDLGEQISLPERVATQILVTPPD